jgi:sec-independent protein translocase protein TatB
VPGSQELLVIALVALFVLGPERLPGLARSAAKGLNRLRNYGVTASKELRGVADLSEIEREVNDLRRELARTRADLRRAMRETVASSTSTPTSTPSSRPVPQVESVAPEDDAAVPADERTDDADGTPSTPGV